MALEYYARHFFNVLREFKDDTSGESLYNDEDRRSLYDVALPYYEELPDDFNTILDVGCGAGYDAAYLSKMGKRVTAITANPTPAQKRFAVTNNFELIEMDMNALDFLDASFDAILCKHSLEHSISPLGSLWELRRVLKPNGYLFLVLPPHHDILVESGHFTQGWSLGQMIYCLCVTGYNVKDGAFRARPGNLECVVRSASSVPAGRGLYELKDRLPEPIVKSMLDDLHGAFPANKYEKISWPFKGDRRETIERQVEMLDYVPIAVWFKIQIKQVIGSFRNLSPNKLKS